MKNAVVLILGLLVGLSSMAENTCHWRKERGSYWVEYNSNLVDPQSVLECFKSIKKPVVLLEGFEDGNEFQGDIRLKDKETGEILASCPTETVNGLNPEDEFDRNRVDLFIKDVFESGDMSGDTTTQSLKWQKYFNIKIRLACPE